MALQLDYDFNGIEIKGAYLRVERFFGSSKEGFGSVISVNNLVLENGETVKKQITTFNHSCEFKQDERGYTTLYKSLQEKFGGEYV